MRKTAIFRFVVLKALMISTLSWGCAREVANSTNFDPEDSLDPVKQQSLLVRVGNYAQMIRSWQLGIAAYTDPTTPLPLCVLRLQPGGESGAISEELQEVCNKMAGEVPQRTTDAHSALFIELERVQQMQTTRTGDALEDFYGVDYRIVGEPVYQQRFVQALLAAYEIQKAIVRMEAAAAEVVSTERRLSSLAPLEVVRIQQTLLRGDVPDGFPTLSVFAGQTRPDNHATQTLQRLAYRSFQHNGTTVGFQQILRRYLALTRKLGIADLQRLDLYVKIIDACRETTMLKPGELPYPFSADPTVP